LAQEDIPKDEDKNLNEQIYLKAFSLKSLDELPKIKEDISKKMILILRITPLAQKSVENLRKLLKSFMNFQFPPVAILHDLEKRELL